jgi:hypothetical protein
MLQPPLHTRGVISIKFVLIKDMFYARHRTFAQIAFRRRLSIYQMTRSGLQWETPKMSGLRGGGVEHVKHIQK